MYADAGYNVDLLIPNLKMQTALRYFMYGIIKTYTFIIPYIEKFFKYFLQTFIA